MTAASRWLRGIAAVLAGLVTILALSLAADHLLHVTDIYPPWGEPMHDPALNSLALAYRSLFTILGAWLAARLAPRAPMTHALALGAIGLVLGTLGGIAAQGMSPTWFLIALPLTALPLAWLGGRLHAARQRADLPPQGNQT